MKITMTNQALIAIFILFIIVIIVNVFFPISLMSNKHNKAYVAPCDASCQENKRQKAAEEKKKKEKNQRVKGAPTERNTTGRKIGRRLEFWNWGKPNHNTSEVEDYQPHRHDDKTDTRKSGNFNLNEQLSTIFGGGGIGGIGGWR